MKTKFEESDVLVNVDNISALVFNSAKLIVENPEIKIVELTALLAALLRPGIYSSIEEAQRAGVPAGTFIIIDDPKTPETEFTIQIVSPYIAVEKGKEVIEVEP